VLPPLEQATEAIIATEIERRTKFMSLSVDQDVALFALYSGAESILTATARR
jgi:hypothetical protein